MNENSSPSPTTRATAPDGRIPRQYIIGAAVFLSLFALLVTAPSLFAPSDSELSKKLLGQWEAVTKEGDGFRWDVRPDGSMTYSKNNLDVYECTWGFDRGELVWRYKQGGNMLSDLGLTLARLQSGRETINAPRREKIQFLSNSQFFLPSLGITFTRLGMSSSGS
jgi:hypothetical protein